MIPAPQSNEYAEYYGKYIRLVKEGNILDTLENQLQNLTDLFSKIDDEKSNFRYAEGKWSIKEVLGHLIDAERVFAYRALGISRNDKQPLLSFDENEYINRSNYSSIPFQQIVNEFSLVRQSNILMFKSFTDEVWLRIGTAGNHPVSVRAVTYILAGHAEHHKNILVERYKC